MSKTVKKIMQWLTAAIFTLALVLGVSVSLPKAKTAQAETAVTFSAACLGDATKDPYGTSIRFDTTGLQWQTYHNWVEADDWKSIADYTTVNGRTVTEINAATTHTQKITLMMQPADSFSFLRLYIPAEIIPLTEVKAMGILDGWSFDNGTEKYTSSAVTFLRSGDTMYEESTYSSATKVSASALTIGDAQLVNPSSSSWGVDSYYVNIDLGMEIAGEYATMYSGYKTIRNSIYINGKSIEEWNTQMIAADSRFKDPSTYTRFPQNSTDASHADVFIKPIGLWGTSTGFQLSIFQELVADVETVTVTVGAGCMLSGTFMVTETVTKTVLTQEVVNITDQLTFLDNSHNSPAAWGATNMYMINTGEGNSCWTKSPFGGCLNECDPAGDFGGQIQMKYIYFNGTSLWDINKNDDSSYNSTQENIAGGTNGGRYAPILVTMSSELGSTLKLTVPTAYGGSGSTAAENHKTVTIKKGFNVAENGVSYYVSNDITFTNNNGTWTKEVKAIERETEVTGIITYANRTDGGTNNNFLVVNLSNNDYAGVNQIAVKDFSSLFGSIIIDGNVVTATPSEMYFNVWGIADSIAFRAPNLDAAGLSNVESVTIKAGAKFPSYQSQYGNGTLAYYVTSQDITFYHDVPNDAWSTTPYQKTYTVTFLNEDGTEYTTQLVKDGNTAIAPTTAPTKASTFDYDYTFAGWYNGDLSFDFSTPITDNITLKAQFTATEAQLQNVDVSVTGVEYGHNGTFLSFVLSAHDSTELVPNLNSTPYNYDVAASGLLDHIQFNGEAFTEHSPNTSTLNPHFGVYSIPDFSLRMNSSFDFSSIQTVTIKAGAQFPSLALLTKTKKVSYTTTEDVTFVMYGDALVNPSTSKIEETDISVEGIVYRPTSDWANAQANNANFLLFRLSGDDYPSVIDIGENKPVDKEMLRTIGFYDGIELYGYEYGESTERYLGTFAEIIDQYGMPGELYINLWGQDNSFGLRVPYDSTNDAANGCLGHSTITKVVIKANTQFPSYKKFVEGATDKDYRLVSRAATTFTWNESWGMFTQEDKGSGIWMEKGASVRLGGSSTSVNDSTSGIRFTTTVSNDWLNAIQTGVNMGTYQSYSFGTLITPTDYLVGGIFTHEWLDTQKNNPNYLDIESTGWAIEDEEAGTKSYHGSIVKLLENNYARQFSGVGYVKLVLKDGTTKYVYAPYETSSARTAEYIAKAAIADNKDSKYSDEQVKFLQKYIVTLKNVTTGRLDSTTMANFDLNTDMDAGSSKTLTTSLTLNGPYIRLEYNSYYNMHISFTYSNGSVQVTEEAYLPAEGTVHTQYLDVFRSNGLGVTAGMSSTDTFYLQSIEFTNVDNKTGAASLVDFTSEEKTLDMDNLQVYLTRKFADYDITIGAHLGLGGAFTYLAKSGIREYESGSAINIGASSSTSGSTLRAGTSSKPAKAGGDGVNLINNYDAGRQIQQSWYGDIGSEYTRGTYGSTENWPYNPVQAGDKNNNTSQIIDFDITETYIYIKARAMDWAQNNSTTKSYMENWYRINDDGTVRVDNAFVDWNGFEDTGSFTSNELPAFYTVQSLNYYVSNISGSKDDAWTGNLDYNNNVGPWTVEDSNSPAVHQYRSPNANYPNGKFENWFAWANDSAGSVAIGCYMPNVEKFTSGRSDASNQTSWVGSIFGTDLNNNAKKAPIYTKELLSNMDEPTYDSMSCYVQNCSYTAPGTSYKMAEYVPIEYSYVIMVDSVANIRENFQALESSGMLKNEGLNAWLREGQS